MRVKQNRGQFGLKSGPSHDENRFSRNHLGHMIVESESIGVPGQELEASVVVRIRLHRLDAQVLAEVSDGV